ncbi:unnamed protein product [Schistocephalus solidus]|uniref:EF-hand domain-containing protein n=1 Tax=Schistocephalus solidus TaxID=70667 RepID=A0A183SZY9_SCHSO|nr:unnamed protein product [Schistocephalus solidus]
MSKPIGKEAALKAFKAMDTDNSGSVSFAEFLASIKRESGEDICESKLREFFKKIDTDKNVFPVPICDLESPVCWYDSNFGAKAHGGFTPRSFKSGQVNQSAR